MNATIEHAVIPVIIGLAVPSTKNPTNAITNEPVTKWIVPIRADAVPAMAPLFFKCKHCSDRSYKPKKPVTNKKQSNRRSSLSMPSIFKEKKRVITAAHPLTAIFSGSQKQTITER